MGFERIAAIPLSRIALVGLALSALPMLLHPVGLLDMVRTWPPLLLLAVLAWRLSRLPAILVLAALVVRGAVRGLN
jgi:hypothetical protein